MPNKKMDLDASDCLSCGVRILELRSEVKFCVNVNFSRKNFHSCICFKKVFDQKLRICYSLPACFVHNTFTMNI